MKLLAKQPGWQDILTKLYVKESYVSYESHESAGTNASHSTLRDKAVVMDDVHTDMFLGYRSLQDEEDEEEQDAPEGLTHPSRLKNFSDSLHFKSSDSSDQDSPSSSFSTAVHTASSRPHEEGGEYQPLAPFDVDLGGLADSETSAGSLTDTPSPLETSRPLPQLRPRKSSSLSNVLDQSSYGTDPPTGDTMSNTSNPQVCPHTGTSVHRHRGNSFSSAFLRKKEKSQCEK